MKVSNESVPEQIMYEDDQQQASFTFATKQFLD